MNKYASGYALVNILSSVGWIVIAVSVIGGVLFASSADRGMGWVGISIAVAGSFQGLLLLGMGAIGTAILDGSVAQQESKNILENLAMSLKPETMNRAYQPVSYPQKRSADVPKTKPMEAIEEINRPIFKD